MIGQERGNFALQGYNGGVQGMKYAYRLGKAMMLPVACLPVAGLADGAWVLDRSVRIWIRQPGGRDHDSGGFGSDEQHESFVCAGSGDRSGGRAGRHGAIASVAAWLVIQNLLAVDNIAILTGGREDPSSFENIENQMIGIFCGVLGAYCSNRYREVRLFGDFRYSRDAVWW